MSELKDTDIEFEACIAQILSLMETLWLLNFIAMKGEAQTITKEESLLLLYLLTSFCHLGKSTEQLFSEDQNAFMAMFRMTERDMNTISIRISVTQFFENCVFEHLNFDSSQVQEVLEQMYSGQLPQNVLGTPEKFSALQSATSIE